MVDERSTSITQITSISAATDRQVSEKAKPADWPALTTTTSSTSYEIRSSIGRPSQRNGRMQSLKSHTGSNKYKSYLRLCHELAAELKHADSFIVDGEMSEEGLEVVVEVEAILDRLYECDWGEKESLKRVVVAINSQINNAKWTSSHLAFLRDIAQTLRATYLIDDKLVNECYDLIELHDLDPFRGTVSESPVLKHYRIIEANQQ